MLGRSVPAHDNDDRQATGIAQKDRRKGAAVRPADEASVTDSACRAILEAAPAGIAQTDLAGRFQFVNLRYCQITGRTAGDLAGIGVQDLFHQDDRAGDGASVERFFEDAERAPVERRYVRPDGREIRAGHRASFIVDEAQRRTGVVLVTEDVTDRKRNQEDLRRREESSRHYAEELEQQLIASGRLVSLGELTASMAHEFNNPLGIILGFSEDLLSDMDPADPNYRSLQIIDEEARRCEKIVKDLLEFARPRSADFTSTDVAELVRKTMEMISSRVLKQKVQPVLEVDADLPHIHADAQQLQQVLTNLCLNALDAMPQGGQLRMAASLDSPEWLSLVVSDTGFGIDDDARGKIFKPFFTAKKRKGLGLGLPISERIVKAHGGSILVESTPNRGTTFQVRLPVRLEEGAAGPRE
jgi:PAS domain S-box-containing protein